MKLYKYCPPERVDILQNRQVSFTKPSNFNDPFDCFPSYKDSEALNPIGQRVYFQRGNPEDIMDPVKQEEYLLALSQHVSKSLELDPSYKIDAVSIIDKMPNKESEIAFVKGFRGVARKGVQDHKLIFSLCEEENNLLMWAHYAAEHSGFVIEFNTEDQYFNPKGTHPATPGKLHQVSYELKRPAGVYGTLSLTESLLTKGLDWKSEKEWRVIQIRKNSSRTIEVGGNEIYLFDIPPSCINRIIFGSKCTNKVKTEIVKILASNDEWSHVLLMSSSISETDYQLNYSPFNT